MKTIIIFIIACVCMFSAGCKDKEEEKLVVTKFPTMDTKFGYTQTKQGWLNLWFYPFSRQDTMPIDSLKIHDRLAIQIEEENIQGNDTTHALPFKILFSSINDSEERFKNLSTDDKYEVFSKKTTTNVWKYIGIFNIPIRFTDVSVPGNDTLEINPGNNMVIVQFVSTLSNREVSDTLILKP